MFASVNDFGKRDISTVDKNEKQADAEICKFLNEERLTSYEKNRETISKSF